MSGYTDLTKLESNRNCLRRIARHDEQQFSKDSIVNVMEKFVKTVNAMDETILVPCRLMDRQVGDSTDMIEAPTSSTSAQLTSPINKHHKKTVREGLNTADLFNLYSMLNSLKNDLLWTNNDSENAIEEDEGLADHSEIASEVSAESNSAAAAVGKGHIRRPSTASMASTNSVSNMSDSESEISIENDSGIESEGHCGNSQKGDSKKGKQANVDKATDLARQCRQHLSGLYRCLEQMTDAANYLTARYQSDIGPV